MNCSSNNNYIKWFIIILLSLYAISERPESNIIVKTLFNNCFFRLLLLAFIIYLAKKMPELAIIFAVLFIIIMNRLSELEVKESLDQVEQYNKLS